MTKTPEQIQIELNEHRGEAKKAQLDACLSCGKQAAVVSVDQSRSNEEVILFKVRCEGCGMQTAQYEAMDPAIQRWNTRV